VKLYPKGVTTNSEQGISSIDSATETLRAMEDMSIPLLIHGETDGFVMDREAQFISIYERLASRYPKLKIVMEHITTKAAADFLDRFENVYATVTVQHLCCTLDDMAGGKLNPHFFCKPILKRPEDHEALLKLALDAHPKLMFGSDSAPHPRSTKECCGCAAGVFSAPIALQILAQLFEEHNALDNLQAFVSDNAVEIYDLDLVKREIKLEKAPFTIPETYGDVVPMWAGKEISWSA
jgi:dihydroorotase